MARRDLTVEGHALIDEYKAVSGMNNKEVYEVLKTKMKGKTWHFGQMHDAATLKLAIGHLKKMITAKKYENNKMAI